MRVAAVLTHCTNALIAVAVAALTMGGVAPRSHAQGNVEGSLKLPPSKKSAVTSQRYANIAGKVGVPKGQAGVVWVEGDFNGVTNTTPAVVEMGQRNFQFEVYALPVRVGTKVVFPNHDDAYHNVFSYSKAKRFDLGRYLKDESPATVLFDKPGVVKLYCEIHEHMNAVIVVVDSPFFTTTDEEGNFTLKGIPAGNYTLKAWLGKKKLAEKSVTLKDGETLTAGVLGQ
jgi:plastocyanin